MIEKLEGKRVPDFSGTLKENEYKVRKPDIDDLTNKINELIDIIIKQQKQIDELKNKIYG